MPENDIIAHSRKGWKRIRTVNEHIPSGGRESDVHAVKGFCYPDLTPKAGGIGETKSHVEHVVFVVLGRRE